MDHIPADTLWSHVLDTAALTAEDRAHLAACAGCRHAADSLRRLAIELDVAGRSTPSPQALARYRAHFARVQQAARLSPLERLRRLVAELVTDSRMRPALAGLRGAGAADYRLLYSAATADIDLQVQAAGPHRTIRGELLFSESPTAQGAALLQLVDASGQTVSEALAQDGSFRLQEVPPGRYSLLITPADGPELQVPVLELS